MKKLIHLFLCLSLLILLTGCGGGSAISEVLGDSKSKEKEIEKWNSYVGVSNGLGKINDKLNKYLEVFGDQKEYQKTDRFNSFLNSSLNSPVEKYDKTLDKASEFSAKGSSDLDKTVAKTVGPVKELWTVLNEADSYYRNKDYVDDNYAKAKTLHEKIIATYPLLDNLIPEFNQIMDKSARELRKKEIKEMQDSGNKVMAAMLVTVDSAKKLQDIFYEQGINSANLQEIKMDVFRPAYEEYIKALNEYENIIKDEKQIKKEKFDDYSIKSMQNCFKEVKATASGIIERYESKKPASRTPSMDSGTPEKLDQKMDSLITRYNQMLDSRASRQ